MKLMKDLTSFVSEAKRPLIVILGPTASGKTALSLKIAHKINGEIISADSCQIYRGMDIATDAILAEQMEKIPHHLLRIADPDETITLAEYKELALQAINEVYAKGHIPVLVGGTGLYLSSIIEDYKIPQIPPDARLREKLQKEAEKSGPIALYEKLRELDPKSAKSIHPNNLRYVIRALEINLSGKQKKRDSKSKKPPYDIFMIDINWPREKLYERVGLRVDIQLKRGLVQEVKRLLEKYDPSLPSMSALGIKEIIPYIKGEDSLEKCIEILKMNTRRYAKRQMTWFRRYKNIVRLTPEQLECILNSK